MTRMTWLNGWPIMQSYRTVLMGSSVHCSGCGKYFGITCVCGTPGWVPPEKNPDWPFDEDKCPICYEPETPMHEPTIDDRLAAYKAAAARRAARVSGSHPEGRTEP